MYQGNIVSPVKYTEKFHLNFAMQIQRKFELMNMGVKNLYLTSTIKFTCSEKPDLQATK